jgi:acetyl esterase/lipase
MLSRDNYLKLYSRRLERLFCDAFSGNSGWYHLLKHVGLLEVTNKIIRRKYMKRDLAESLDPELKGPIKMMLSQMPPMSFDNLSAARAASKQMMAAMKMQMPVIPGVVTEDRTIPGPKGAADVAVRIYRPEKQSGLLPSLLWIHGGGYILGEIDQEDFTAKQFTLAAECIVVSVEYRLAPEHPYPAPLEDCYAALKWLSAHANELGVDCSRIAIGGASAGGGLAAGLAILTRDRAEVEIMFQLLVYPMINDCNIAPASDALPDALFWTRENNLIGWRSYLGCEPGSKGISCYAAAFRATNLEGLPAAYITVGDIDLFAQEDIDYSRRLIVAGVPTELHVYPGGCHAFDMLVPGADVSKRFTTDIHRALKRALHN